MADQHLIMAAHTTAHWPTELYLPSAIVDRDNREAWTKPGSKDTYQRACDEVDRRLAAYRQLETDPAIDAELHPIIRSGLNDAERALPEIPIAPEPVSLGAGVGERRHNRRRERIESYTDRPLSGRGRQEGWMSTRIMRIAASVLLALGALGPGVASAATPISIYGAWHCSDDACTWAKIRKIDEFDSKNHWIIDRGDGTGRPSVNLVILSFVNPLSLLNGSADGGGAPVGMTPGHRQVLRQPRDPGHGLHRRDHLHGRLEHGARPERDAARPAGGGARDASWRRHRDRLRAELQPQPWRAAGVHRCLSDRPPV